MQRFSINFSKNTNLTVMQLCRNHCSSRPQVYLIDINKFDTMFWAEYPKKKTSWTGVEIQFVCYMQKAIKVILTVKSFLQVL